MTYLNMLAGAGGPDILMCGAEDMKLYPQTKKPLELLDLAAIWALKVQKSPKSLDSGSPYITFLWTKSDISGSY